MRPRSRKRSSDLLGRTAGSVVDRQAVGSSSSLPCVRRSARSSCAWRGSRERVDAADHDLELARGDGAEQLADHRRSGRAAGAVHQPEADHRRLSPHQVPGRHLVLLARGDPEGDHAPERGERAQRGSKPRRRSSRARRRPARRRLPRGSPSFRSSARESTVASAPSRSTSSRFSALEASADHPRAGPLGELHGEAPGPAGSRLDHDRLARLEPARDGRARER